MVDITEPRHFLTRMMLSVMNAREEEFHRVSRILHNDVGQVLSAAGLQLDVLRLDLEDRVPEIAARTAAIQQMLEQAFERIRELSYELNPNVVERAGLSFALDRLAGRLRRDFKGTLRLLCDPAARVPVEVGNLFYRIAEQALENAVRHSRGGQVEVLVKALRKSWVLEIRDNGTGFPYEEFRKKTIGLGLLLMEYYASQGGLDLKVDSQPGKGTVVRVAAPTRVQAAPVLPPGGAGA